MACCFSSQTFPSSDYYCFYISPLSFFALKPINVSYFIFPKPPCSIVLFDENDIRPKNLDEGKLAAFHEDLTRLRAHSPDFVYVSCPSCGSSQKSSIHQIRF